jgi:hypothetical protein
LEEVVSSVQKPEAASYDNSPHPSGDVVINVLHQVVALCEEKPQKEVRIIKLMLRILSSYFN